MRPIGPKLIRPFVALALLAGVAAAPLSAQGKHSVPRGFEPPRGMCRIWIEGVPPGQQPSPTDCATAIRKRPPNASVVFGEPVRNLEEADRIRDRLPTRELWNDRRGVQSTNRAPQMSERAAADRARVERGGEQGSAPRSREAEPGGNARRAEPARSEPTRAEPRRTEPARTPPAAEPQGRSRRPPPDMEADLLARERWQDQELLASLYGDLPPGGVGGSRWMDDGRAAPASTTGERGRGRSGADDIIPWALNAYGEPLSAREVEVRVRGELAMLGGQYGYGAYGGYAGGYMDPGLLEPRPGECMDRNFDGRCDDLMGGPDGCPDRNGDGRCDDARYDSPGYGAAGYGGVGARDPLPAASEEVCPPGVRCDPYRVRRARESAAGVAVRPDDRRDDVGYSSGFCFDRDRDGRCDEPWSTGNRIPQTLPSMESAVALRRGVASYDVERWLRRTDAQARVTDRDGDGLPERVTWIDGSGRIVQIWTDLDGDGIADRVELFRDGLPVQVIAR